MRLTASELCGEPYTAFLNGNPIPYAVEADTKAGYVVFHKMTARGLPVVDEGRVVTQTRWGIVAIRRDRDGRVFTERD